MNIEYNVVKDKLLEIEGVTAVHDLRIWSLTLNQTVMSGHLAIGKRYRFKIFFSTVICYVNAEISKNFVLLAII